MTNEEQILISRLAAANAKIDEGVDIHSPLKIALENKNDSLVEYLLREGTVESDSSILQIAYTQESMGLLIDNYFWGAYNTRNWKGETLLHHHAAEPKSEAVGALLRRLADCNAITNRGYTPLHYACNKGNKETVMTLIAFDAKIDAVSYHGYTILHMAVGRPDPDLSVIEFLLENGVDINAVDADGNTALHVANWYAKSKVIELLLRHGANPDIRNKKEELYNETKLPQANSLRMFL